MGPSFQTQRPPLSPAAALHTRAEGIAMRFTPWQTWQRPTLPRLKTEYHRRWGVSRPSSEWDRVQPPRYNHQVSEGVKQTGRLRAVLTPIEARAAARAGHS